MGKGKPSQRHLFNKVAHRRLDKNGPKASSNFFDHSLSVGARAVCLRCNSVDFGLAENGFSLARSLPETNFQ